MLPSSASPAPASDPASVTARVTLAPSLMSDQAGPLLEALHTAKGPVVRLDAQAVERIGGLCLQVLIAAARTFAASGRQLIFDAPSDAFLDALMLLGARTLLMPDAMA